MRQFMLEVDGQIPGASDLHDAGGRPLGSTLA